MTKTITREACGAGDCIYNKLFRCVRTSIEVDETTKCMDVELSQRTPAYKSGKA